ncbi:putative reverse transcriptase domain-containing protein [Tanacetum coccineum]
MDSMFDNSGCTANQRVSWNDFKALLMEELCPCNEIDKLENEFCNHTMVGANHVAYTDRFHELAKLVPYLVTPESSRIKRYINGLAPKIQGMLRATQPTTIQSAILTAGILTHETVRCGTLTKGNDKGKQVAPVNAVRMGQNQRACYECGSLDHFRNNFPKWRQATGQARNPLALEGNKNTRNNRNQARGRAFKIADGKNVEVDRVIFDCKLELGNSLFTIDLIPLGHGSFDVIMGMDWLSKNKAVIVCHEKVVEIPIKEGGIL